MNFTLEHLVITLVSLRMVPPLYWFSFSSFPCWIELINERSKWNCTVDLKPIIRENLKTVEMIGKGGLKQPALAALLLIRTFVSLADHSREMSQTASKGWKITQEKSQASDLSPFFVDGAVTWNQSRRWRRLLNACVNKNAICRFSFTCQKAGADNPVLH